MEDDVEVLFCADGGGSSGIQKEGKQRMTEIIDLFHSMTGEPVLQEDILG